MVTCLKPMVSGLSRFMIDFEEFFIGQVDIYPFFSWIVTWHKAKMNPQLILDIGCSFNFFVIFDLMISNWDTVIKV